jgi:transcriptional regulator with XRE-family HTH domain
MPESAQPELSKLLRSERRRSQLTVRELAERAGLVPSTVSRLEHGIAAAPKPTHLQRLASALSIDVEELYAAAGFIAPQSLPELRPYLRVKYNLPDDATDQIEGYVQALRDRTNQHARKGGGNDNRGDQAP